MLCALHCYSRGEIRASGARDAAPFALRIQRTRPAISDVRGGGAGANACVIRPSWDQTQNPVTVYTNSGLNVAGPGVACAKPEANDGHLGAPPQISELGAEVAGPSGTTLGKASGGTALGPQRGTVWPPEPARNKIKAILRAWWRTHFAALRSHIACSRM